MTQDGVVVLRMLYAGGREKGLMYIDYQPAIRLNVLSLRSHLLLHDSVRCVLLFLF